MAVTHLSKTIKKEIDSFESYLKTPSKYHVNCVRSMITALDDLDDVRRCLEVDKRKSVQVHCGHIISREEISMDYTLALTLYYKGQLSKKKLGKALKGDVKYLDYIISEYEKSRERNSKLKRKQRPEIMPVRRLHNIDWREKINISPEMMVDGDLLKVVKLGLVK